ncbi:6962_t:CDS:2 [Ambispora leptoticha]|uniref:6962_t:CDS:1 n=1 Tax=Ambispora leptoticha TaxID=144679 RepID=A0A9N8V5P2_9GLOM|nr:6962_t:CDS:2 [Ambispora leptoticha]
MVNSELIERLARKLEVEGPFVSEGRKDDKIMITVFELELATPPKRNIKVIMKRNKDFNKLSEKEIIARLESDNYEGGNIGLPENPTLEERTKYKLCKSILVYQLKNKLPFEKMAESLAISEEELYDICRDSEELEGELILTYEEFPKLERKEVPQGVFLKTENRVEVLAYTPIEERLIEIISEEKQKTTKLDLTQKGLRGSLDLSEFDNLEELTDLKVLENLTELDISYNPNLKEGLEDLETLEKIKGKGTVYEEKLKKVGGDFQA